MSCKKFTYVNIVAIFVLFIMFTSLSSKPISEYITKFSTPQVVNTQDPDEYTEEEEQLLDEAYETMDTFVIDEAVTTTVNEDLQVLVEDEGYLENLRQNPLDLNTATITQLKGLPGITSEIARNIIRYRRTRKFQSKSDLRKIKGVTSEIYRKILPYVKVVKIKQPSRFKGQIRLRTKISKPDDYSDFLALKTKYVPKEKFQQPIYLYNRSQFNYGDKLSFGYTFLQRPYEIQLCPDTAKYFLRKYWVRLNSIGPFDKILIGDYKTGFGYGVVMNENYAVETTIQSVKPKMRGLREDKSTSDNANLRGIGFESSIGVVEYAIFYSEKGLITATSSYFITEINDATGEVTTEFITEPVEDLVEIRRDYIEYNKYLMDYDVTIITSTFGRLPTRKVTERLVGFNFTVPINIFRFGICGYYSEYNKPFDPIKSYVPDVYSEKWRYVYRGDRLGVGSFYFEFPVDKLNIFGEIGTSYSWFSSTSAAKISVLTNESITSQRGFGLNLGFILPVRRANFYLLYTHLEPTFYTPLGSPARIYDYHNNQHGVKFGNTITFGNVNTNFSFATGELFKGIWSGYSGSEAPRYPSRYNEIFLETKYKPLRNLELYFRTIDDIRERYINLKTYGFSSNDDYVQTEQLRIRNRYQVSTEISKDLTLRFRYDQRWHNFVKYNKWYYGEQLWTEFKYKFAGITLNSRICIFDTEKDVYLSYLEPQWYNVYISETEASSTGDKFYVTLSRKFTKNTSVWFRYRYKIYVSKNGIPTYVSTDVDSILARSDHDFRLQLDIGF
ncbi:MAG: helix-hairpin-helix domain-containing protein [Endomicrobia bacterium]|nr:helix-hairpin-helix domain-containing protein [Endomicrobiia bacterium]